MAAVFGEKLYTRIALGGYYYMKVGRVRWFDRPTTGHYPNIKAGLLWPCLFYALLGKLP